MKKFILIILGLSFLGLLHPETLQAQKRRMPPNAKRFKSKSKDPFENIQWWLGVKAGANLTQAVAEQRYTPFSSTDNADPNLYDKTYQDFSEPGVQAGVEITFFYRGFSASFQPNYRRQRFTYSNQYQWFDPENAQNSLELNYSQDHKLDYIEFPLIFKYDILKKNFRPTVFFGGYYATLIEAQKAVSITGRDFASGFQNDFQGEEIIVGAKDLFIKSSLGLIGGIGFSYDLGNIRFAFDASYRYGMNNISNAQNRYVNNSLAGVGDVLDDIKLRNISFSLSCLFPMRFLRTGGFKAVD